MPIKNPRELFVPMLSKLRQGTEPATKLVQLFTHNVQRTDVRKALVSRIFVSQTIVDTVDKCFSIIGESQVTVT